MLKHKSVRVGAAIGLVGFGVLMGPGLRAYAGGSSVTGSGIALNPIISQSDLLATPDSTRLYAAVSSASGASGATNTFTINTVGAVPSAASFPKANGDIGITYQGCGDATGAIASAPVVIGVGHRGCPVYDGPYPGTQGWKICTYLTIQAATPNDYGVEIFDPVGNFTFFDFPELTNMTAPAIGANSVTLSLPSNMCFHVNPPAPPLVGQARTYCEPFFSGSSVHNALVETQINAEATLPFPVCVNTNPPGISCNGNQTVGPIFGIVGLLATSGWAPGSITCGLIANTIPNPATCAASAPAGFSNAVDFGLLPLPPEAQAIETCANPLSPPLVDCTVVPSTWTYNPCQAGNTPGGQDQGDLYTVTTGVNPAIPCPAPPVTLAGVYDTEFGRITPDMLPKVDGFDIGPAFSIVDDGFDF